MIKIKTKPTKSKKSKKKAGKKKKYKVINWRKVETTAKRGAPKQYSDSADNNPLNS